MEEEKGMKWRDKYKYPMVRCGEALMLSFSPDNPVPIYDIMFDETIVQIFFRNTSSLLPMTSPLTQSIIGLIFHSVIANNTSRN